MATAYRAWTQSADLQVDAAPDKTSTMSSRRARANSSNSTWRDSTRLDSTHSTCRAHAFWLWRASRTAQLDSLDTTSSTGSTGSTCRARLARLARQSRTCRVESSQVEFEPYTPRPRLVAKLCVILSHEANISLFALCSKPAQRSKAYWQ